MKATRSFLWATRSFVNIKKKITVYGYICWKLTRTWKPGISQKVFDLLMEKRHLCLWFVGQFEFAARLFTIVSFGLDVRHRFSRKWPIPGTSPAVGDRNLLRRTNCALLVMSSKFLVDVSSIGFKEHRYPFPSWTVAIWNLSADTLYLSLRYCFTVFCFELAIVPLILRLIVYFGYGKYRPCWWWPSFA